MRQAKDEEGNIYVIAEIGFDWTRQEKVGSLCKAALIALVPEDDGEGGTRLRKWGLCGDGIDNLSQGEHVLVQYHPDAQHVRVLTMEQVAEAMFESRFAGYGSPKETRKMSGHQE